jgi:osmotically-inducible protein OsmY
MSRLIQAATARAALPVTQPVLTVASEPRDPPSRVESLAQRVERGVVDLTCGGVRDLEVRVNDGRVHLRGFCGTFYIKQLAQTAAMSLAGQLRVVNQIDVRSW